MPQKFGYNLLPPLIRLPSPSVQVLRVCPDLTFFSTPSTQSNSIRQQFQKLLSKLVTWGKLTISDMVGSGIVDAKESLGFKSYETYSLTVLFMGLVGIWV